MYMCTCTCVFDDGATSPAILRQHPRTQSHTLQRCQRLVHVTQHLAYLDAVPGGVKQERLRHVDVSAAAEVAVLAAVELHQLRQLELLEEGDGGQRRVTPRHGARVKLLTGR